MVKALILLKGDVSDAGEGWSDSEIIRALDTTKSMVYCVRKQLVEEGLGVGRGAEPQSPGEAAGGADFRRREGSQTDRPGVFPASGRLCALELAAIGGEGRRTQYRRARQRQHDWSRAKKTLSSPTAKSAGSFRPRRIAPS